MRGRRGLLSRNISLNISSSPLILDTYPGAAAAYSLRKLRIAYTGAAIRVRRSSDSAEQDIGFLNGVLDTATLLTFCGASNGFVTTWYDQSTNGRNFSQATTTLQPQIVASGSVVQQGSKPAVDFLETKRFSTLAVAFNAAPSAFGVFAVASPGSVARYAGIFSPGAAATQLMLLSSLPAGGTAWGSFGGSTQTSSAAFSSRSLLEMQSSDGSSGSFYLNGSSAGTFSDTTGQAAHIGGATGQEHDGTIQEIVFYETNQASNRAAIAAAINAHYAIY